MGWQVRYPMDIEANKVVVCPSKYDPDTVKTMLDRLDWPVLTKIFSQLGRLPSHSAQMHARTAPEHGPELRNPAPLGFGAWKGL
jgi:hypothetical protein